MLKMSIGETGTSFVTIYKNPSEKSRGA